MAWRKIVQTIRKRNQFAFFYTLMHFDSFQANISLHFNASEYFRKVVYSRATFQSFKKWHEGMGAFMGLTEIPEFIYLFIYFCFLKGGNKGVNKLMFTPEAVTSRGIVKISSEKFLLFFILIKKKILYKHCPWISNINKFGKVEIDFSRRCNWKSLNF